jgi:lipopolysaccharide transport system ATP-binding protein
MDYRVLKSLPVAPYPNFHIYDERGQCAFVVSDRLEAAKTPGVFRAVCEIPARLLNDGAYFVGAALTCSYNGIEVCFYERDAVTIHMIESISDDIHGPPRFGYAGPIPGVIRPKFKWAIQARDFKPGEAAEAK